MWRRLFRKPAPEADLEEELQAHLAIETKQLMEHGLTREQAGMEARRLFGNQTLLMEATREVRGHPGLSRFWQDIRYAARVLRREPAFTVAAGLSVGRVIGKPRSQPIQHTLQPRLHFGAASGLRRRKRAVAKGNRVRPGRP